ncbi:telomere binding protein [Saitoella coloradoensis]
MSSPDPLTVLKSRPDVHALTEALAEYSASHRPSSTPDPGAAQFTQALLAEIVPVHWEAGDDKTRKQLICALATITGLGGCLTRLDGLLKAREWGQCSQVLQILSGVFGSFPVWRYAEADKVLWREYIALTAGGRILGKCAEVLQAMPNAEEGVKWLGEGKAWTCWLGSGIAEGTIKNELDPSQAAGLLNKALGLGHTFELMDVLVPALIPTNVTHLCALHAALLLTARHNHLHALCSWLSRRYLSGLSPPIAGAAALLSAVVSRDELEAYVLSPSTTQSLPLTRAVLIALHSQSPLNLTFLNKILTRFSDGTYIAHVPTVAQEALTQLLLSTLGRFDLPLKDSEAQRLWMESTSNRLTSTGRRRWLGMVVGEAVDKSLKFGVDEMKTGEAQAWKALVDVGRQDGGMLGQIEALTRPEETKAKKMDAKKKKEVSFLDAISRDPEPATLQLDSDDEDGDYPVYELPDSDDPDSDDDPTLINREKHKITPPVYIRNLLETLRASEPKYDAVKLALEHAEGLVRRHTSFGTELDLYGIELANTLAGTNDEFDMPNFVDMRQRALVALVVGRPKLIGPWAAEGVCSGKWSLGQRMAVLAAISSAAVELSGQDLGQHKKVEGAAFASKLLPKHLHAIYADNSTTGIDHLIRGIEEASLKPIAAEAADALSGPEALKVGQTRRFSRRPEVQARQKKPEVNALAQIAGKALFFPLAGGWWMMMRGEGVREPSFAAQVLKTLGIVLRCSAPSANDLREMTSELWGIVFGLCAKANGDDTLTEALLFALLVIFEVHEPRGLAEGWAKEVVETREWVGGVFEHMIDEGRIKMLAAGILLKINEVAERFEVLLMGGMLSFGEGGRQEGLGLKMGNLAIGLPRR